MVYGILLSTFKTAAGSVLCLGQGFHSLKSFDDQLILNNYDCPLLELTKAVFSTPGSNVRRAVSVVHECTTSCHIQEERTSRNIERENITCDRLEFQHDFTNLMYSYNVCCML